MRAGIWALLGACAGVVFWGCGRKGVTYGTATDTDLGPSNATFVIGLGTFTPSVATVPPGARVTFLNRDSAAHEIVSDTSNGQPICPELDGPVIAPESRFTFIMGQHPEICGFHDLFGGSAPSNTPDTNFGRPVVQGTIIVAVPAGSGSTGTSGTSGTSGTAGTTATSTPAP